MKIDAHQHFWQFDPIRDAWISKDTMSVIRRDFLPSDLAPLLVANGFDTCVAVQADQSETETLFLLDLAKKNDFVKGVVGWVDLKSPRLSERLDYFSHYPNLKGFRHILQGETSEFILDTSFVKGVILLGDKGYTYDILVYPNQLTTVGKLLQKSDSQPFVIDHLAKPYIEKGLIKEWEKDIRSIATYENVYCKVSGMVTEADWQNWQQTDFTPYLDVIFEAFGTDRVMYGSDWPVSLLAAMYEEQVSVLTTYTSKLTSTEQEKIWGLNAKRFYNI